MLLALLLAACAGDPDRGAEVYARTCANCHGEDGDLGVQLDGVAAPDLAEVVPALDDDALASVIVDGTGAMPPQDVDARETRDVIAWLRQAFP
jgi:mono/diheme cytochrome c family protein